ncbi:hypothetical protein HGB07_06705 [Candidatus Roizmanbacteria bacterium]|nr:hypothetical protein [Candidatus Roizmanbacteria bacterium]
MQTKSAANARRHNSGANTIESLRETNPPVEKSFIKQSTKDIASVANINFMDILLGRQSVSDTERKPAAKVEKSQGIRREGINNLFNYEAAKSSKELLKITQELQRQVKQEVTALKKASDTLQSEISDIEKISINGKPEVSGIYHIRFLEIILSLLRQMRAKIGESRTWLAAMTSKKKKRGSLFATATKKKQTNLTQSNEITAARSVT